MDEWNGGMNEWIERVNGSDWRDERLQIACAYGMYAVNTESIFVGGETSFICHTTKPCYCKSHNLLVVPQIIRCKLQCKTIPPYGSSHNLIVVPRSNGCKLQRKTISFYGSSHNHLVVFHSLGYKFQPKTLRPHRTKSSINCFPVELHGNSGGTGS
mmetsp:Transcript_3484/g.7149  ORF Transcript_3484/g.7149 Transcript_3484/m.7149 type:complete len:156 (+) Transcript_3484:436-903(+)